MTWYFMDLEFIIAVFSSHMHRRKKFMKSSKKNNTLLFPTKISKIFMMHINSTKHSFHTQKSRDGYGLVRSSFYLKSKSILFILSSFDEKNYPVQCGPICL